MTEERKEEIELTPEDEKILDDVWKEVIARRRAEKVLRVVRSVSNRRIE